MAPMNSLDDLPPQYSPDFNLCAAASDGNLEVVRWLVEKENLNPPLWVYPLSSIL